MCRSFHSGRLSEIMKLQNARLTHWGQYKLAYVSIGYSPAAKVDISYTFGHKSNFLHGGRY